VAGDTSAERPSADWLATLLGAGAAPGPSLTVQSVVTGALGGDAEAHLRLDDGVVVEHASGTLVAPDVTLTATSADAAAMAVGELDPNVTFMQGRMKTAGDPGLLLELLAYVRRVRRAGDREGRASR
jgi:hypothetical protein